MVLNEDQLMLVTDAGKIIRIRVDGGEGDQIRVAGRKHKVCACLRLVMMRLLRQLALLKMLMMMSRTAIRGRCDEAGAEAGNKAETSEAPSAEAPQADETPSDESGEA